MMNYIILKFTNGTRGVVITGMQVSRSDNGVVLYGSKTKVTCKDTLFKEKDEILVEGDTINIQTSYPNSVIMPGTYTRVIEHLNYCITENTEPINSGLQGLQMVRITNAILESSRAGKVVKVR